MANIITTRQHHNSQTSVILLYGMHRCGHTCRTLETEDELKEAALLLILKGRKEGRKRERTQHEGRMGHRTEEDRGFKYPCQVIGERGHIWEIRDAGEQDLTNETRGSKTKHKAHKTRALAN